MNNNSEKMKLIQISKYIDKNGQLWEEIYNPERKVAQFVSVNEQSDGKFEIKSADYFDDGDIRYIPIFDESITKKAILLPIYPAPYKTIESLIDEICNHILMIFQIGLEKFLLGIFFQHG